MTEATLASRLLLDALSFAVERHGNVSQARKGTAFPYVLHPLRVAEILRRHGYEDELIAAGMLHDTIEDAEVTAAELTKRFGERVARLVQAVSEADRGASWRERKAATIAKVAKDDDDVLAVLASDKLDNIRSIRDSLAERGEDGTWALFKVGRDQHEWYYRSLADAFLERDPESDLFQTLHAEVDTVFRPADAAKLYTYESNA
jgi:(p)ppGpp synthase/HD superfamily hydrolase